MYESPIDLIMSNIQTQIIEQQEEAIYKAVFDIGVNVKKEELIRALQYDRDQYNKGYSDGEQDAMDAMIRCKDCTHSDTISCSDGMVWCGRMCRYMKEDGFCSFGERKKDEG